MAVYEASKGTEIEDLAYFAKDSSIVSGVNLANKGKDLVTLTYNRGKQNAFLNRFSVNSEKLVHSLEFPIANSSGNFPPLRELPSDFTLVENVRFLNI